MDYIPFYSRYDDITVKETRTIKIMASDLGVPCGEYGLLENYCTDKNCDCRRTIIHVVESRPPHQIFATIGYGWETVEFYTKWMHGDEEIARTMTGAYLEIWGIQSSYAQQFFEIFKAVALTDDEYVSRIKRHYTMFKDYDDKKKKRKMVALRGSHKKSRKTLRNPR